MYLDLMRDTIRDTYNQGPDKVFEMVKVWLQSRGFREDDFSDQVFIDRQMLDILKGQGSKVFIDRQEYQELLNDSNFLTFLIDAGLDNWEGYDSAVYDYNQSIQEEED